MRYLLLLAALFTLQPLFAIEEETEMGTLKINPQTEIYDSLVTVWYKDNINLSYDEFVNDFINIDMSEEYNPKEALPDSIYSERLNMLVSAIQLPYNPIVKQYILRYTIKYRSMMSRILGLAQYYMPIFEKELDINDLPEELKIMPVIESILNPKINSPAGAGGLWQFMLPVGKYYGLEYSSFVDERYDPLKSTQAACKLIKDYYKIYGDWTLVIAAYNCGPGNVNKAIRRVPNAKTYWDIYDYLPRETRGHIPSFIGMTYAYTFHKAHGIEPQSPPHPIVTDTVHVNKMMHFEQVASTLGLSMDLLRELNPQYKRDIIPAKEKSYVLVLPMDKITSYVEHEKEIFAKDTTYLAEYLNIDLKATTKGSSSSTSTKSTSTVATVTYKVKSGDNLGSIANRYKVSVSQIMRLNGITNPKRLKIGQTLKIK